MPGMNRDHTDHTARRFNHALRYLHAHYNSDSLDLHRLAEEAALSPWHWHRLYRSLMGETPYETIKWMRLHRAAWLLRNSDAAVATIARHCGYRGNVQSFNRTFRAAYGLNPQDYRARIHREYPLTIDTQPPIAIAYLPHADDYLFLSNTFNRLKIHLHLRGQYCRTLRAFSIHLPEALRGECGVAFALPPENICAPLLTGTIAGGRYAVLHYHGPYADLDAVCEHLLHRRLPSLGEQAADAPVILEYLDDSHAAPQQQYRVNISVPLQPTPQEPV